MEIFLLAVLLGLIPAMIAKGKGRSFGLWWFYGAALFIVALPHSLIMKASILAIERQQISEGMQKCPKCAEFVKTAAQVCRFCGNNFSSVASESELAAKLTERFAIMQSMERTTKSR